MLLIQGEILETPLLQLAIRTAVLGLSQCHSAAIVILLPISLRAAFPKGTPRLRPLQARGLVLPWAHVLLPLSLSLLSPSNHSHLLGMEEE